MKRLFLCVPVFLLGVALFAQQPSGSTVLLRNYGSLVDGDEGQVGDAREESFQLRIPADGHLEATAASPDFAPYLAVLVNGEPARRAGDAANAARVTVLVSAGDSVAVSVGSERLPGATEFADYLLSVVLSEGAAVLEVGGSTSGTLSADDRRTDDGSFMDRYELRLPPESRVRVDLASQDFDTYLEVELPDGRVLENDDASGSDSGLSFATGDGGRAIVGVTSYGPASVGPYTLRAFAVEELALGVGEPVEGELDGSEVSYVLSGTAGQVLRIELRSNDFDTYLEVSDADGTYLYNDDADGTSTSRIVYEMASDGTASVVVSSFGGSGGTYTLEAAEFSFDGPRIADGHRLEPNETVTGTLGPHLPMVDGSYRQRFTFELGEGARAEIVLRSDVFDSYLTVVAPDGTEYTDDDSAGGLDSRIVLTGEHSGVYEVYAADFGTGGIGGYTLSFATVDDARLLLDTRGALTRDDSSDITGRYYDLLAFDVSGGRLVTIDVVSEEFDGYALVRTRDGRILHRDDDGGGESNPRISFVAERAETLELVVTTYGYDQTGGYAVSIYE